MTTAMGEWLVQGCKSLSPKVNMPCYFPKMTFYSQNYPFIFQKCPFVSRNCPFYFPEMFFCISEVLFYFSNMPYCFPELPYSFPEKPFFLFTVSFSKNAFSPADCNFCLSCSKLLGEIIFAFL